MIKNRQELIAQLKDEFPEIFKDGMINLILTSDALTACEIRDEIIPTRCVLIEKVGNVIGRKTKLLKLFNQLRS